MNTFETNYTNMQVIDRSGQKVGIVSDVIADAQTFEPQWLVVDVGVLHTHHYVPAIAAHENEDGQLVIPFDKDDVKTAMKPNRDHILGPDEVRELRDHYRL